MRAWLLVCAALALAPCRATAAHAQFDPARLERIKSQILAKLGLTSRPTPLGAPPRDVVRQILARAADPHPQHHEDTHANDHAMREVIAIAHRDKCSIACKGSPSSQVFAPGQKYNYGVEGTVNIFLTGTENKQETSVKLLGQVSVTAFGNCAHELSVQNLVLSGPDGKKYQSPPGIDKPIQFSLQDGSLGAEICAEEGDTRRSLNIKRAIISLLQTELKSSTQVDIFGVCPTEISHSQEGGAVLVHRTRDLSRCAHREQTRNDLVASVFNPSAEIKESQILQSSLHVETKVNNGVPEKVSAAEEYLYKPFAVGENGARAKVHTKLTLTGKAAGGPQSACTVPRTVIFENPHSVSTVPNNVNNALQAVKETAKVIVNEATEKSAGSFAQLVRILRVTGKDDLMKVFNQVKGNSLEKRVYLDALLRTGTGPSIEASIQILKGHNLNELETQLVYLSLGNARHVSDEALKAATSLVDQKGVPKEIYLGVGALAGAYCRQHQCHSVKSEGIVALSQKLGAKLQNCRPKTKVEEDYVVAVLKGIRNIRHLEDSLIDKLVHCANDHTVKARVKTAALEAFLADPCSQKIKKTGLDLMKNRQLDSEIRIKAYLAVIACPCGKSANEIKNLLDSEPVHQVGRFISTSLRHIRASANPDKQLAKQHYGQISTPNKFRVDDRKYSFFREQSFNIDALGIGGSVDQTVIYSQDSFLPRSAALNLTTQIFGHSYNVLELGGRQGNLDLVVEHFLGPKGILQTKGPQALYDTFMQAFVQSTEKVKSALNRGRRSVKSEIDAFDKNLKAESTTFDNELDLDIYMKLFGTDAVFLSLGNDKGFDLDKAVNQIIAFLTNTIDKAKHLSQELRTHLLFIDAELAYPTSSGLPLRLDLTGAATARIDLSSNFDLKECINNPQNAKFDVKFVPSTDVEITGVFLVDADAFTTGLKVITNLHSSTGLHVIAKVLENGRGFDLQLGLPVDKQEIVVASNNLVYFTADKGCKEKQTKIATEGDKKDYAGCFDQLSGLLGLTLCGEISLPFSVNGPENKASIARYLTKYPITGISKVKLVLEKNDLKGYHIRGVVREDQGKSSFELLFDAQGSKNRRTQLTGERTYTNNEMGIKLALESPLKSLSGELSFLNNARELAALIKAKVDTQEYYGRVGFNVQSSAHKSIYKPIFEYQLPEDQKHSVQIDGQVIGEQTPGFVKYSFDGIKLKLPNTQDPISIEGFFSSKEQPREIQWQLVSQYIQFKGGLKANDLEMEFTNPLNQLINFRMKGHSEWADVIKNEIDIVHSGDLRDESRRIVISQYLKYKMDKPEDFNVITKNKFEIVSVPFKIVLDGDVDPKKIVGNFQLKSPGPNVVVDLKARCHIKRPEDYSVKLQVISNKAELEVFSKRDCINNDKSNFENYVSIKGVARYELSGVVLHKIKEKDLNIGANGHLKITGAKNENIKFDIGVISNTHVYSSHAKVSSSQGELVDFLLKVNAGANPDGLLKFLLKDTIAANGQYKVTDANGAGNGMVILDFKKIQRKIKADAKFTAKGPVFNADFDIFLNYEKDNNDKICLTTNTKHTEKVFDSKNKLEYGGKTSELNIHKDGILDVKGKTHASVEIVLPTERCLNFKVERDMNIKDEVYNGNAKVIISDAPKRGAGASTITYTGKLVNTNFEKDTINYEGQLDLKLKDGKNLVNTFSFKNNPEGEKFKFDFKTEVTGNVLAKPASLVASAVYVDALSFVDDTYRVKAQYGDDISAELDGTWIVKLQEDADKKYLDDFTVTIHLPFEKSHDIKWVNHILFVQPKGNDVVEFTVIESVQVNADVYKIDSNGKLGPNQGSGTLKLLVPHVDPVVLETNYKNHMSGDKRDHFVEVKGKYGKGKSVTFSADTTVTPNGNDLVLKVNAPQMEKMKKLELTVHSKNPAPDTYSSTLIADADGRVYKAESTVVLSKAYPVLDLKYTSPSNPKTSKIYIKGSALSSTQGKVEVKIGNVYDTSIDMTSEATVQKDNVNFKVQADSNELGWKNFVGEIASKDAGSGKRLEFTSTNDGKNVLSGSTSYISKQEGQKTIIEGSGSVKLKDEQKSASFKYIRTILTEGNEKGVETFFNVALGERSYVAESRVTNLEYKNSHVYCEEKKQCAHAEIQSKIDVSKSGVIANIVSAGFDLRKLGVAPELGLTIRDEVSTTQLPQYTLDLHANKQDKKYHLHVYNTPVFGHSKSGIKIQTPQRTMLLENSVSYPTDKMLPFPIKGDLVLDLDNTKSGHKAAARFLVDLNVDAAEKQTAIAEFGFSHPKIGKEALVRIQGAAVRTDEHSIKIETTGVVSHNCLGHDREAKILFEASPTNLKFLINTPLVKVIDIEGSATVQDKLQKGELKFVLLEGKPVQVHALVKDFQYYEFTTAEADRKLSIISHVNPEKRVDISADIVLSGQKKNIAHGAIWLDNDQMKTDYGMSKDNGKYFLNAFRKDLNDLEVRVKQLGDKASNDFKDITRRAEPTIKKLQEAYADDLGKIYKEIADDKVLKELSQAFHDVAQYVAKLIEEVIHATKPIADSIAQVYSDNVKKIGELYEKEIEPKIKQVYESLAKILKEYLDSVIDVLAHVAAIFTDFFEKHKPELQELTNTFAEIFKDLTRLAVAHLKEYRAQVQAVLEEFTQWFKDLPIFAAIKDKWEEFAVPDQITGLLQQAHDALRPLLPTPESQEFADTLNDYVLKKLRKEKCDDNKELRVVYQRLVTAMASLVQFVRGQLGQYGVPTGPELNAWSVWNPIAPGFTPSFGGETTISFIKQIISGDFPSLVSIIRAYRPRSLNPLDEVPSKLRAVVVNGQHIFTFDGRHLTFPGSCRYVLAHDHVDRNFTLLLQMADGKPKALVLEDKSGSVIELKENGQVTLNNANHGFPVEEKDSFAFRQTSGRIGIGTQYGLKAFCTAKLEVCYIEVNGFYLGKLRGLLGDGNNEPYDDFRLPNGKLCTSESEFGNSYRLAKSCPQVTVPEHSHHQLHHTPLPEACEKVFGGSSPLKNLALLLDIAPFRQACIHAVGGDSTHGLQQACDLGRGYTALAVTGLLPAVMPDVCMQCTDADKPRSIGDTYSFKLPNKQADIIVAVETTKTNEQTFHELVVPLVSQLVDGLKSKKISDIKVYLVGITSRFPYAITYDTDLKLKNCKITFDDNNRYDFWTALKTGSPKVDESLEKFVKTLNELKTYFGFSNIEASYAQLWDLPWRAGAVKHIIAVTGETCGPKDVISTSLRAAVYDEMMKNIAMTHSLVTVTDQLAIGNGKNVQNVVGFSERRVVLLGDNKAGKGTEDLKKTLTRGVSSCIDFSEEAGGLILSSTNFHGMNPGQQKQFIQTAYTTIVQEMFHESIEQACVCGFVDPFRARSICYSKDRKEVARRRK